MEDTVVTVTSEVGTFSCPRNGDMIRCAGAGADDMGSVAERDDDFPELGCAATLTHSLIATAVCSGVLSEPTTDA